MSTTETITNTPEVVVSTTGTATSLESSIRSLNHDNISTAFPDVFPIVNNESKSGSSSASSDQEIFDGHDEEQIKLMDEVCIVLDWNDKPIGGASKKTCHLMENINQGLLHRAFSVFLFNSNGDLLLQQRADEKITFPGMWTNTCCSHPLATPSELGHDLPSSVVGVKQAAQRKLDQELGIKEDYIPLDKFNFLTRIYYVAPSSGVWGEHEIDYILFIRSDPELDVNPNEVKDTRYVSKNELLEMFKDPELTFTPWFKLICESYLFKWWDNLANVTEFSDEEIHRM